MTIMLMSSYDDMGVQMPRIRSAEEIGQLIAEQRRSTGTTQEGLAHALGVSRQWVIGIEKGKQRAELETVLRALNELELEIYVEPRRVDQ